MKKTDYYVIAYLLFLVNQGVILYMSYIDVDMSGLMNFIYILLVLLNSASLITILLKDSVVLCWYTSIISLVICMVNFYRGDDESELLRLCSILLVYTHCVSYLHCLYYYPHPYGPRYMFRL